MTFTALRGRLFLYGGSGPSSKCFQDLHIFERKQLIWLDVMNVESNRTVSVSSSLNEAVSAVISSGTNRNAAGNPSSSNTVSMEYGTAGYTIMTELEGKYDSGETIVNTSIIGGGFQRLNQQCEFDDHGGKLSSSSLTVSSGNPNDAENTPTIYVQGKGPGRRAGHTATAVHRKIYFFGGSCGSEYLNDLFILDTDPVPKVAVTEPTSVELLKKRLSFFVNEDDFSDVIFIVEGKRVYGHQMILSLVSDCFRVMFTRGFRESTMACPEIVIPYCSYDSFVAMMVGPRFIRWDTLSRSKI